MYLGALNFTKQCIYTSISIPKINSNYSLKIFKSLVLLTEKQRVYLEIQTENLNTFFRLKTAK